MYVFVNLGAKVIFFFKETNEIKL